MATLSPPTSPKPHHDGRPRAVSAMSFSSNKSRRSNSSSQKMDLTETARDKKRFHTTADPSKALVEAQPSAVALEQSNLEDLRSLRYKDADGNVITDPDRSNPTRNRLERPLDTIRSFNAAAEGTSSRRTAPQSNPPSHLGWDNGGSGRRGSYYSGPAFPQQRPRAGPGLGPGPSHGGYYRNGSSFGFGAHSSVEEVPGAGQMYGRNMRHPPNPYSGDSPMSVHSHQYSYDNMTSGSDENSKSTNPSSQNSSFDQLHQVRKPDDYAYESPYANELKFSPVSPQKPYSPGGMSETAYGQDTSQGPPPPVSEYIPNNPRQPIKLNSEVSPPPPTATDLRGSTPPKKQSWIKRRFSRRDS